MRKNKRYLTLSHSEYRMLVAALVGWRNKLLAQGKHPDAIDEIIEELYEAKTIVC